MRILYAYRRCTKGGRAMLWIAIAATFLVGIITLLFLVNGRSDNDLGSVSARWVADHHIDRA